MLRIAHCGLFKEAKLVGVILYPIKLIVQLVCGGCAEMRTIEEAGFDSEQRKEIDVSLAVSRPALWAISLMVGGCWGHFV
jgi:hypothetical protein